MAGRGRGDHFGRARRNNASAFRFRFGAEIDDPVGAFEHLEIVLDDDERIALIDEALQNGEEQADVLEMEARGRLVEDEEAGGSAKVGSVMVAGGRLHCRVTASLLLTSHFVRFFRRRESVHRSNNGEA